MAYAVTGDPVYLRIIKNAYDFLQNTQCYATGGYGPPKGSCRATGISAKRWISGWTVSNPPAAPGPVQALALFDAIHRRISLRRLGRTASLQRRRRGAPIKTGGKGFYYADFRIAGLKYYHRSSYTCCSGSYIQDMAEYHNQVYYRDDSGIYVNLYLPTEAVWNRPEGEVKLTQETRYPEAETSLLTLQMKRSMNFAVKCRVPGWARDMSLKVNGADSGVACKPGTWAVVSRTWNPGDRLEVRIPLRFRLQAIDKWHPNRVAVVRDRSYWYRKATPMSPSFSCPRARKI